MAYTNEIIKINENLYCIKDVQSVNKYLILGKEKALLFDTGYGFVNPMPYIRQITDLPLIVVDSHGDCDHAAGNFRFSDVYISVYDFNNLKAIDNLNCRKFQMEYRLKKSNGKLEKEMAEDGMSLEKYMEFSIYEPNYHLIDDGFVFELGGRSLEVISIPGHTSGSIALLDKDNQYLFTGDSVMKYNVYMIDSKDAKTKEVYRPNDSMYTYLHSLYKLKSRINEYQLLFPAHGEFGLHNHFVLDLIENMKEIYEQKGVHERFTSYSGIDGIKHSYKDTLIYYDDEKLKWFQNCRL